MGRPSKKKRELIDRICLNLASGCTRKAAAIAAGISETTFYAYMADKEFPEFSESVIRAEANLIVATCTAIRVAGKKDWRANAWMLERRFPDDYKLRTEVDVTKLTDEQVLRALERTAAEGGDTPGSNSE